VIEDDPRLLPRYRMPRVFGALPGPRNLPRDKQQLPNRQTSTVLSLTARTDAARLSQLLPPGCELDGPPQFSVSLHEMQGIRWLAGHGYSMLIVSVRMKHCDPVAGWQHGEFIPVLWENLGDPIITGREELGMPKLYAEIPPLDCDGPGCVGTASWKGFEFFRMTLSELREVPVQAEPAAGMFFHKFIPRTGALHEAEVETLRYEESMEGAAGYAVPVAVSRQQGIGTFAFREARWEDMPLQYPIVNWLAALPVHEVLSATVARMAVVPGATSGPAARRG